VKLKNILWVPAVAIALGFASLASPVTARQQAQAHQVDAKQSQPKAAETVLTSGTDEGAYAATTGESFATVALFPLPPALRPRRKAHDKPSWAR
jgi:hypothetical protein